MKKFNRLINMLIIFNNNSKLRYILLITLFNVYKKLKK